jgi:hypothetical protein
MLLCIATKLVGGCRKWVISATSVAKSIILDVGYAPLATEKAMRSNKSRRANS